MEAYAEQLKAEKLDEMKSVVITITSFMVLPLYLIFWITDLVYAPEYKWEFLGLRLLVIPIALLANYYIRKVRTLECAQGVGLLYVFSLAAIINVMILIMADPSSPYYTGLILIAIGGLGFFPWDKKYFIYVVAVIFIPYICIEIYLDPNMEDIAYLVIIGFFINGTVTIFWVIRYFRENLRIKEIVSRLELKTEIEKRKSVENDLIDARDQALKASKAKSTFLANMSHELRTPLNAIIGYSELLQESVFEHGNEIYVDDLKKIDSAGQHLLKLINGVLDISKIEAGQMDLFIETFDLKETIKNVESTFYPNVEKRNNTLSIRYVGDVGVISSDEIKLRQVLYNILSNANKFTETGKIELVISVLTIYQQEWLRFDVIDTGIGMTSEQQSKVFNAFTQADSSTTKKYGGTGLGLSICWHFCKMLGGNIFIKSNYGEGTVVSVLIPRYLNKYENKVFTSELEKIVFG